jgi:DNA-binding GntR family transcriptional regulator
LCRFAPLETLSALDAIRRKDAEGAATAVPVHLENALERMFGSWFR